MLQTFRRHCRTLGVICGFVLLSLGCVRAGASPASIAADHEVSRGHERYFIEFRARDGLTGFGHAYIIYGRLDDRGEVIESHLVGFSDGDNGAVHLYVPRAAIGPLQKDFTHIPTAVYRRILTADQFRALNTKIRDIRHAQPPFHMLFLNCTDFLGEIAEAIGLPRPPVPRVPTPYVRWLRAFNGA